MNCLLRTFAGLSRAVILTTKRADFFSKIMALSSMLLVVIGFDRVGLAVTVKHDLLGPSKHMNAALSDDVHTGTAPDLFPVEEKSDQDYRHEEYKALEKELKELLKDLKRLEKMAEDKIRNEILPLIKKEIERLKKKLREFRFEEGKSEPIKT